MALAVQLLIARGWASSELTGRAVRAGKQVAVAGLVLGNAGRDPAVETGPWPRSPAAMRAREPSGDHPTSPW